MKKILLYGAGGHASSCINIIEETKRFKILGLIDKNKKIKKTLFDYNVIGNDKDLEKLFKRTKYLFYAISHLDSLKDRIKKINFLRKKNFEFPTIISKSAKIGKNVKIGSGTIIMDNVFISNNVSIGNYCIINNSTHLDHDVKIKDNCHLSTSVVINGFCNIGNNCFVGSGSVMINNYKLKANSFVKMGSIIK